MDQILAPVAANFSEPHRRPGAPVAIHLPSLVRIGFQRVIKKAALVRPAILPDDDAATLAARVLEQEQVIYPLAVRLIAENQVRVDAERALIDDAGLGAPGATINPAP